MVKTTPKKARIPGIRRPGNGLQMQWLRQHVGHSDDGCLMWPFFIAVHGYGTLPLNGKVRRAHRVMCELAHGAPPAPDYHAAHACGNPACVNPKHLSWKTRKENQADCILHGTASHKRGKPRRSLTWEQVAEIRSLAGTVTQLELAERYGVQFGTISKIQRGETWRNPPPKGAVMTPEAARIIGVPSNMLAMWKRKGLLKLAGPARGAGHDGYWTPAAIDEARAYARANYVSRTTILGE